MTYVMLALIILIAIIKTRRNHTECNNNHNNNNNSNNSNNNSNDNNSNADDNRDNSNEINTNLSIILVSGNTDIYHVYNHQWRLQ